MAAKHCTSTAEAEKALPCELDLHFNPSFRADIEFSSDFLFSEFWGSSLKNHI